jgi:WD40 repeat protein
VKPVAVSTIDASHKRGVADLAWLPPTHQLSSKLKVRSESDASQFLTVATDGAVCVWDVRYKEKALQRQRSDGAKKGEGEVPWVPVWKMKVTAGSAAVGMNGCIMNKNSPMDPLFVVTEEGQMGAVDWAPPGCGTNIGAVAGRGGGEDEEGGGDENSRLLWLSPDHHRPSLAITRSPFFADLLLSVGDKRFSLWQVGKTTPLFESPASGVQLTCGRWSLTRPGVIILGRVDGCLEVWDLTDQTNRPVMTPNVVSTAVTSLEFRQPLATSRMHLLAVGDAKGTLHVLDLPVSLRKPSPGEPALMQSWVSNEAAHAAYVEGRKGVRAAELAAKEAAEAEAAAKAEAAASKREAQLSAAAQKLAEGVTLDVDAFFAEQEEAALAEQEEAFLALEAQLLGELGLAPQEGEGEEELATGKAGLGQGLVGGGAEIAV